MPLLCAVSWIWTQKSVSDTIVTLRFQPLIDTLAEALQTVLLFLAGKGVDKTLQDIKRPHIPTLVTAPCSALKAQAAARALQTVATATRTSYGQAQTETQVITVFFGWAMVLLRQPVPAMIPAGVLIPTPLLCAVSWI